MELKATASRRAGFCLARVRRQGAASSSYRNGGDSCRTQKWVKRLPPKACRARAHSLPRTSHLAREQQVMIAPTRARKKIARRVDSCARTNASPETPSARLVCAWAARSRSRRSNKEGVGACVVFYGVIRIQPDLENRDAPSRSTPRDDFPPRIARELEANESLIIGGYTHYDNADTLLHTTARSLQRPAAAAAWQRTVFSSTNIWCIFAAQLRGANKRERFAQKDRANRR